MQEELRQILYPVFVYFFVYLILYGSKSNAYAFVKKYRILFDSTKKAEIDELHQHLKQDIGALFNKYLSTKYTISLSHYAKELLMHFVALKQLKLVKQIINLHILININHIIQQQISHPRIVRQNALN